MKTFDSTTNLQGGVRRFKQRLPTNKTTTARTLTASQ
jgi:hypothetical protein